MNDAEKPMHCAQCGKVCKQALYLNKNGKRLSASFCSRDCYLKFWEKVAGFIPLPDYN